MALRDIINAVVAQMQTVEGIGQVHDHVVTAVTEADFRAYFYNPDTQKVLGWTVTREATDERDTEVTTRRAYHTIVVRGFMGVQEAKTGQDTPSENVFQDLVETVRSTFNAAANRKLAGACEFSGPMTARRVSTGFLGPVLCHYCELVDPVIEYPLVG